MFGKQSPVIGLQVAPAAQSTAPAQGKAHFWNCTLQRASPQEASLVQGSANAPGVAMVPPAAGAGVALGVTGAGVAAATTGCGCATAGVVATGAAAGATYGAGAAAGGSLSLAQAVAMETKPIRAIKGRRSIEFLFPRRAGRSSKTVRSESAAFILASTSRARSTKNI